MLAISLPIDDLAALYNDICQIVEVRIQVGSGKPGLECRPVQLNHHRVGSGEPLVLMHGIGSRWQIWEPVMPRLVTERDVIAIDLPGFGASPMPPPGTPPGVQSLTQLVGEFLEEIGVDRPHAAGNSLGGWISLELAKQGRVRSATGLSPAGFHNDRERIFQRTSLSLTRRGSRLIAPRADLLMRPPAARASRALERAGQRPHLAIGDDVGAEQDHRPDLSGADPGQQRRGRAGAGKPDHDPLTQQLGRRGRGLGRGAAGR